MCRGWDPHLLKPTLFLHLRLFVTLTFYGVVFCSCRTLVKKNMCLCICFSEELDKFMESQGASAPGILTLTTSLSKPFMRLDKYPTLLQELERHVEVLEKWNMVSFFCIVYNICLVPCMSLCHFKGLRYDLCVFMSTPGSPSRLFWHFKGNSCLQEPCGKSPKKPPHLFVGPFVKI